MCGLTVILFCAALSVALAGCVQERGDILSADPHDYSDASFLTVPDDEDFWLAPLPKPHGAEPADVQVPKGGMWLKAGLILVESQCYTPKRRRTAPITRSSRSTRTWCQSIYSRVAVIS